MSKFFLSLFTLLFFSFPAYSEVKVKKEHIAVNDEKGRCAWASLETAGLTNGWEQVKDWTKNHPYSIYPSQMVDELTKAKIQSKVFLFENKEFYYFVKDKNNKTHKILDNKKEADDLILAKGIDFYHIRHQHWDLNFIKQSIKRDVGAIVVISYVKATHAIYITDINDEKIKFIDSNYPKIIREESLEWFMTKWIGIAITIEKKKN